MEAVVEESSKETNKVEALWKESLGDLHFFHGTSEMVAEKVKQNGLSQQSKPYNPEGLEFLRNTLTKLNLNSGYAEGKESHVFITSSLGSACSYAIDGPEMMRIFYLDNCDAIQKAWELGIAQKAGMIESDLEKVMEIKNATIKFLNNHRPVLLEIKRNSPALQEALRESLGDKYSLIENMENFEQTVQEIVKLNPDMSEEEAAKGLITDIRGSLNNLAIQKTIPPEDLTEIKGDAFYAQTGETREVKKIIDNCLFDVEERPSELIRDIEKYVSYGSGNSKTIQSVCDYYHINASKAAEIVKRVESYKKQKSS